MSTVVLSHYHCHKGPCVLYSIPLELDQETVNDLCRILESLEEPGFFIAYKNTTKIVNWYFEMPNDIDRGGKDILMASVILTENDLDPMSLKDSLKQFIDELKVLDGLNQVLYFERLNEVSEQCPKSIQEARNNLRALMRKFKESIPEFQAIIRVANEEDLTRINEIDYQLLGTSRPDFWEKKLEMLGSDSLISPLVAETENKVIGFIFGNIKSWIYGDPENIGWIDSIGVDPVYQKMSVSQLLMEEMLNSMKRAGIKIVYTLVNWQDSDILQFLEKIGFKKGNLIDLSNRNHILSLIW